MGQTLRSWKPKRLVILSTRVQTWRYPNFTHAQLSTSTEARGLLHSENGSTPWQKNCRICTGFDQMFDIRSKYVSDLWPNDFRWNQESKQKWVVCIISLCVYVNVRIYMYIYMYIYICIYIYILQKEIHKHMKNRQGAEIYDHSFHSSPNIPTFGVPGWHHLNLRSLADRQTKLAKGSIAVLAGFGDGVSEAQTDCRSFFCVQRMVHPINHHTNSD